MVTEIILNQDVDPGYMYVSCWIKYGITADAVLACMEKWEWVNHRDSNWNVIRNLNFKEMVPINKLNKW